MMPLRAAYLHRASGACGRTCMINYLIVSWKNDFNRFTSKNFVELHKAGAKANRPQVRTMKEALRMVEK